MVLVARFKFALVFVTLLQFPKCSKTEDANKTFEESSSLFDAAEILIPTLQADGKLCRNHSRLYLQELKKYRLWATENMLRFYSLPCSLVFDSDEYEVSKLVPLTVFDASSKFPTGVISGSVYDLGNFDQCIGVRVPLDRYDLRGKYCLAKFKIVPLKHVGSRSSYEIEKDPLQFNISVWEKITAFSSDRSKGPRNEIHFSFCLPSSCTYKDLETSLNKQIRQYVAFNDFSVEATVQEAHCQVEDEQNLSTGDISFLSIVLTFFLICISASVYHLLTKLDDLRRFRCAPKIHQLVKCFSIPSNLKKLGKKASDEDGLECIHGMKVISMCLIIMGHRIMFEIGSPTTNPSYIENFYKKVEATVMLNGPIIVDTFFNISGFLATYLLLQEFHKRKKTINFLVLYVHRFIRLTPAYAIVLAFYCTVFALSGSGPLWHDRVIVEQERCLASWWANMLYINNYLNTDKLCMFQSWYLTCDMHLFLLTPFLAYLLWKKPQTGIITTCCLLFLSILAVFLKVFISDEDGILLLYIRMLRDPVTSNQFKTIYIPTHLRASPYIVGILTGYLKYRMKLAGSKMPKALVYCGWVVCVFIMEATVYSAFLFYLPDVPKDPIFSALYSSMHHFTWSLCISWMIIAISCGHGSWITPIISWRPLALLSRITYAAFLCHGGIQLYSAAILRQPKTVSIFSTTVATAADIFLSYVAGLLLSQIFEAPILGLEKILLRRGAAPPQNDKRRQSDFDQAPDVPEDKSEITRTGHRF